VFSRNASAFQGLVAAGADVTKKCQGSPLAHVILAVGAIEENEAFALEALDVLSKVDAMLLAAPVDEYGRTPLRLACELALPQAFISAVLTAVEAYTKALDDADAKRALLLKADGLLGYTALHAMADAPSTSSEALTDFLMRGAADVLDARDAHGRTALHVAALANKSDEGSAYELLVAAGSDADAVDANGKTALELAKASVAKPRERRGPTVLLHHDVCLEHLTCPLEHSDRANINAHDVPPENVNRLHVLLDEGAGTLQTTRLRKAGLTFQEAPRAELGDIVRVHDWGYLRTLQEKCADMDPTMVDNLDGDTVISGMTFEASLYASGAAMAGVDAVFTGKAENAFCAVRPPGHHAGPCGLVPGCTSHGFCMVNNVAVAAAYALNVHRSACRRVAIVDFDVHHGNGTEVCVNHLQQDAALTDSYVLPTGGSLKVSQPMFKPWLGEKDFENVLFCSVHGFGKARPGLDPNPLVPPHLPSFYPASGANAGWKEGSVLNYGQNSSSRDEWRDAWANVVLPRVTAFAPDLILVSAGFDAHQKDGINGGFIGALECDYTWLTRALVGVANQVCQGRVVSVLEGGYRIEGRNVSAFARSVHDHVLALAEARPDVAWDGTVGRKPVVVEPAGEAPVVPAAVETVEREDKRPTRRRPAVDYAKLNEELVNEAKRVKQQQQGDGLAEESPAHGEESPAHGEVS